MLRVDNGYPWGSSGDLPPALALWVLGLGVAMAWNPAHRPTANAKIERTHGVATHWTEPARCLGPEQLQARLTWACQLQREHYPAVHGRSRWVVFPGLAHSGRAYVAAQEASTWQVQRVYAYLACQTWRRRANSTGQISLYNQSYVLGRPWAHQTVSVRFDPAQVAWHIASEQDQLIVTHPAQQLTAERIVALQVARTSASPGANSAVVLAKGA